MAALANFREIWLADFEFTQADGERPTPICLVAREMRSGRTVRLWQDQLGEPPYPLGPESLFVAFYAPAELGCHLALRWGMPARILDLYAEFRNLTSGRPFPGGSGLLAALTYYGLDGLAAAEKESLRGLAMRGGPYTPEERKALLAYCESDVAALAELLPAMLPDIDLPRALLRGRYMAAVARMEAIGVPIDLEALTHLRASWGPIQGRLIERIDRDYGVFEGRTFRADRWAAWLSREGVPWPRLDSGELALDDDTFREMARSHPQVAPMRELRYSLSQLRLADLAVGADGRNRCPLSPFRSTTGRNQPSNSRYIFGPAVWIRGLIRPGPGMAVAYIDRSQQEFGIAAALSGDVAMMEAYRSGDPYLAFGKQAGRIPPEGTRETHGTTRDLFKACVLGVQYGMGERSLARRIDRPVGVASELLQLHRRTYASFWAWSDAAVDHAMLHGSLQTTFGWRVHAGSDANPRSLRNFPMQANGAEMLRLACSMATERGIGVCAPVHDALLIEGPSDLIDEVVAGCRRTMQEASEFVLPGFPLRSEAKIVHHPDRYVDERGKRMWEAVWELVGHTMSQDGTS